MFSSDVSFADALSLYLEKFPSFPPPPTPGLGMQEIAVSVLSLKGKLRLLSGHRAAKAFKEDLSPVLGGTKGCNHGAVTSPSRRAVRVTTVSLGEHPQPHHGHFLPVFNLNLPSPHPSASWHPLALLAPTFVPASPGKAALHVTLLGCSRDAARCFLAPSQGREG